jgi:hypothetical protein
MGLRLNGKWKTDVAKQGRPMNNSCAAVFIPLKRTVSHITPSNESKTIRLLTELEPDSIASSSIGVK